MGEVARRVRVRGVVQGVFFRHWTCDEARELGVKGWVWNRSDGAVEARLQGEEQAVNRLIARMREGPPSARVDEVEVTEAAVENFDRFDVRH